VIIMIEDTMLERVAQVQYDRVMLNDPPWTQATQEMKEDIKAHVRAAFEAMLDPTEAMLMAGYAAEPSGSPLLPAWQAMIKEAMK
jgi:hypothetical protein